MPLMRRKLCISIHAPTRGATKRINRGLRNLYFNPRSYKRSDLNALLKNPYVRLFQSTLLQEERRKYLRPYPRHLHFNPRSYKRSDAFSLFCQRILINISIHAPTRGATIPTEEMQDPDSISIHAPTRGATHYRDSIIHLKIISIHAPTRGATKGSEQMSEKQKISIHAPTRGATAKMHNIPYASLQ